MLAGYEVTPGPAAAADAMKRHRTASVDPPSVMRSPPRTPPREIGFYPGRRAAMLPTMRAARIFEYQQPPRVVEVPEPAVTGPFDVVVRVAGAGVCRTDLHI